LPEVKEMVAGLPTPQANQITQKVASDVTKVQEVGGLTGRLILAFLIVRIASRQRLIRMFQIPGLIVLPLTFAWLGTTRLEYLQPALFVAGVLTVGQFSFWGNYLPRVYPIHLRGTGESFAANIGGRLIGTCFAWVTATLAVTSDPAYAATKVALVSGAVGFSVYLVGLIASFWLPEPKREELPE
jgi:sugar phosphate permease